MKNTATLILMLFVSASMWASISFSEKDALVKLYIATNGNQWKKQWDFNKPVSSWYGVKLQNDKVVGLDLSNNNLTGQLPSEIVNLVYLKELKLFKNTISGTIPSKIGNMKQLVVFNLSFNEVKSSGLIKKSSAPKRRAF